MLKTVYYRSMSVVDYVHIFNEMKNFTETRKTDTPDQIWLLEHFPVFTQGQNGRAEHILAAGDIPVVPADRGGQVTYHGPGQLIAYVLIDIKRQGIAVRQLVTAIEQAVIALLADYKIEATTRCDAPGVYVKGEKIASLGLRIKRGCSYHGLALNVDMDLSPFSRINPCGFSELRMTQMREHVDEISIEKVRSVLLAYLTQRLGYTENQLCDA